MRMASIGFVFFFNDTATTEIYTLSLHDASSDLLRVCPPLGILRGETLVVVVVTVENHVGTRSVEGFPKRLHLRDAGTVIPRGEQWVVEVDKRTRLLVVGGEILLKPADLGRDIAAATDFVAVAVEGECARPLGRRSSSPRRGLRRHRRRSRSTLRLPACGIRGCRG